MFRISLWLVLFQKFPELSDFQHILKHRLLSDPFDNRELQELYQKLSETTKIEEVPIPQSLRKQPSPFADIATTKTERKTDWEEYKKIWSLIKEEWLFAYPFYKYHIEKKMIYINFTFKTEEKLTYNIVQPINDFLKFNHLEFARNLTNV